MTKRKLPSIADAAIDVDHQSSLILAAFSEYLEANPTRSIVLSRPKHGRSGRLVELERRAWHLGHLAFMISQRRGYDLSPCESRLVELLGNPQRLPKDTSQLSVSRKGERTLKARDA